ncbi:MAG: class I SAM-dependent DNA methyltransferase [Clostridia bacterium]|nr:class I SAM-dependent DNA methyltransferase [Clostridia bacterium]
MAINMADINEKVRLVFKTADLLRGPYTPDKYGNVIIPMAIIRRFDCILEEKHEEIQRVLEALKGKDEEVIEKAVYRATGIPFYNKSGFTLARVVSEPQNIDLNFNAYVNGFSKNVLDILQNLEFKKEVNNMVKNDLLFQVVKGFMDVDFHSDTIDEMSMGYIFEEIIRKFKENAEAGDHYTPREVIELCVELLLAENAEEVEKTGKIIRIYDGCCGTGGMLTIARRKLIERLGERVKGNIQLCGQDVNPESYSICKAEALMLGLDPNNIVLGNTLTKDGFNGKKFDLLITNPPFGIDWKTSKREVEGEFDSGGGRFKGGLPRTSDGQLLFLQNMISKLDENGRLAIIMNGSPLFTGGANSGESNIRKWIIRHDLLEAIIALPDSMFYNTGINTYVWVLSARKSAKRQGRVQLIDARECYGKMKKSLGNKRKELRSDENGGENDIAHMVELYKKFEPGEFSKTFDNSDFGYYSVTVERPLRLRFEVTDAKAAEFRDSTAYNGMNQNEKAALDARSTELYGKTFMAYDIFFKALNMKLKNAVVKQVVKTFGVRDQEAEPVKSSNGGYEPDAELRDNETVPLKEDVCEYFESEVRPHVPDAWYVEPKEENIGFEIPFTRHFYKYVPPRPSVEIKQEILALEAEIQEKLKAVLGG